MSPDATAEAPAIIKTTLNTVHGLRHTSATLLLAAGEPVHVVGERLGHRDVTVTLTVYAHVLKTHQQGAADRISALLHGLG